MSNSKVLGFTLTVVLFVFAVSLQENVSVIAVPISSVVVDVYVSPLTIAGNNDFGPVFSLYNEATDVIGTMVIRKSVYDSLGDFLFTDGPYIGSELTVRGEGNGISQCQVIRELGNITDILGGTGAFSCANGTVNLTAGSGLVHLDKATITYETSC